MTKAEVLITVTDDGVNTSAVGFAEGAQLVTVIASALECTIRETAKPGMARKAVEVLFREMLSTIDAEGTQ